ncbi:3-phenylpropionate dioxygenase ferredoxin--NAD(+) reductase component [Escherichia coli]|uniref:3-phenylpropionate dioxygenase ferredoxin--NAD(+) reductase component n=1 Tax=Escherichia coli TaxID=562 RepID=A0A376LAA2_ECOLX|nr:3-phenylpropionate dioxygenase ferredoxin--NAD(+) reductase component [Escherichia coli]
MPLPQCWGYRFRGCRRRGSGAISTSDNLQFIGDMHGDDWLCRGNPETQKAIWFNLQNGVLIGAVTLNQGREIRPIRKWIQSGKTFDAKLLTDEDIALKSL